MSDPIKVSAITTLSSLLAYYYAKGNDKDTLPCMVVGGFIGNIVANILTRETNESLLKKR